jgi:hypothetical protein
MPASPLIEKLLETLDDAVVEDVRVGAFWTAVVTRRGDERRCGLAATLREAEHVHGTGPSVPQAGRLIGRSALELAQLALSSSLLEASIGMAIINALVAPPPGPWEEGNAEEVLARDGDARKVALVGHFPFVDSLRTRVGTLWVLELHPHGDDLPAEAAPQVIPQADMLAITATTLINGTFDGLLALRRPDARVMLLGPSAPLSPVLFEHGVDLISGSLVERIDPVLAAVSQGGNFRQVHRAGVRLVNISRA